MFRTLAMVAAVLTASGCHKRVAIFSPPAPPIGSAVIYVYRNVGAAFYDKVLVSLDGQVIGDLPGDHYVELRVAPGQHSLSIRTANDFGNPDAFTSTLPATALDGKISYFQLEYAPVNRVASFNLESVDGSEAAAAGIGNCQLKFQWTQPGIP